MFGITKKAKNKSENKVENKPESNAEEREDALAKGKTTRGEKLAEEKDVIAHLPV